MKAPTVACSSPSQASISSWLTLPPNRIEGAMLSHPESFHTCYDQRVHWDRHSREIEVSPHALHDFIAASRRDRPSDS